MEPLGQKKRELSTPIYLVAMKEGAHTLTPMFSIVNRHPPEIKPNFNIDFHTVLQLPLYSNQMLYLIMLSNYRKNN